MTIYFKHKWHYFNEGDELCIIEFDNVDQDIEFRTACNRDIKSACRHTELKSQVTCVKCLQTLNKLEENKKMMDKDLDSQEDFNQELREKFEEPIGAGIKPIYEFYVAGVQHHQLHTCIDEVSVGQELKLSPDPSNRFDPFAVSIWYEGEEQNAMVGFVPKAKGDYSSKVTALLDLGRNIKCIVTELNKEAKTWEQLKVAIVEES